MRYSMRMQSSNSSFAPSASQLDTNEVDPVAEADVYIAYGRDAQAEEILKEALRTHPERYPVRLKLLEIYATRKDARSFETLHKQPDGTFTYVPVGHKVVGRYLGFMHRVGLLDGNTLRLSPRGRSLAANWENRGNGLLLEALDTYLRDRGMTRDQLQNDL